MKTIGFWISVATILFVCSIALFTWTLLGQLTTDQPIDSDRFSDFGSFIGGVFGIVSFILLVFTFKETKGQSFDNSFFNHLQLHDSVVQQLKSKDKEIVKLNNEYKAFFENDLWDKVPNGLKQECIDYSKFEHVDYFEALYGILHVRYKYLNETPWSFIRDNNWRVGHFLNSFTSVVELIGSKELDNEKRNFYTRVMTSRATSDEIRLVFYFVTFNDNEKERIRLAKIFQSLNFFDNLRDGLIKDGDKEIFLAIKD